MNSLSMYGRISLYDVKVMGVTLMLQC